MTGSTFELLQGMGESLLCHRCAPRAWYSAWNACGTVHHGLAIMGIRHSLWATVGWLQSPMSKCHREIPEGPSSLQHDHSLPSPHSLKKLQASRENTYFSNALFSSLSVSFFCQALCFLTRVSHKALMTEMSNTTTLCPILGA